MDSKSINKQHSYVKLRTDADVYKKTYSTLWRKLNG